MKRLRLQQWSGQLLSSSPKAISTPACCIRTRQITGTPSRRNQSSIAPLNRAVEEYENHDTATFPSPLPRESLKSAKLAALHARLALPKKLPLETMARTLVDPSADANKAFNNVSLALVGGNILSYHVAEWLLCHYPRLPLAVLYAAQYAFTGPRTLHVMAQEWGVDSVAAPGGEVDPGYLQFKKMEPGATLPVFQKSNRPDKEWMRRGMSSRVVYDNEFGDRVAKKDDISKAKPTDEAYAGFVRAVIGALYLHGGQEAAKTFIKDHILSRHLDMASLFQFSQPIRDLKRLCAREDFEDPVARILSETGRYSRTPVFVVGIFSGSEKLGEGADASLDLARERASVAALKSWYLYSPGPDVNVPSDMEGNTKKSTPWEPVHIDIGEIV